MSPTSDGNAPVSAPTVTTPPTPDATIEGMPQTVSGPTSNPLNPDSIAIESTPGGIRVKLPTLVLAHVLSLAGVCGGAYSLNKPDVDQTKSDIAAMAARMERIERDRNAVVERLARIETLAENIREDLRDQRAYGRAAASASRRQPANQQPTNPADQ